MEIEEKLLKQTVKVYEHGERNNYKTLTLKKTQTLFELLQLAKLNETEDFCTGLDLDKPIRLRTYDPKLNVMLKPFEDNSKTLLEENIYSHFIFKIE